jgi:septum formation protein
MPRLILASTSRYRRELLARLRLPFDVTRPDTDETPLPDEPPAALAQRLAVAKATAAAHGQAEDAWVLGSDQVAELDGAALGKPGGRAAALAQLAAMSGHGVCFRTAICLAHADGRRFSAIDTTIVRFRTLDRDEIARYVDAEQPFDCAGSFKSEGLGITLFESIQSQDPTALVGLPLIATARLLREAGFQLP